MTLATVSPCRSEAVKIPEGILNNLFVNPLRRIDIFGWKPFGDLDPICWDIQPWEPKRSAWEPCGNYGRDEYGKTIACEDATNGMEKLCFYERVILASY